MLSSDIVSVVQKFYEERKQDIANLLIVGHSVGGAVAVHVASTSKLPVIGVVVVDLVEGSALASMSHIKTTLETRPSKFLCQEDAVEWR